MLEEVLSGKQQAGLLQTQSARCDSGLPGQLNREKYAAVG